MESIEVFHGGGCWSDWGYRIRIDPSGTVTWAKSFGVEQGSNVLRDIPEELVRKAHRELTEYARTRSATDLLLRSTCGPTLKFEVLGAGSKWSSTENRGEHAGFDSLYLEIAAASGIAEWFVSDPFLPPEPEPVDDHPGFDDW